MTQEIFSALFNGLVLWFLAFAICIVGMVCLALTEENGRLQFSNVMVLTGISTIMFAFFAALDGGDITRNFWFGFVATLITIVVFLFGVIVLAIANEKHDSDLPAFVFSNLVAWLVFSGYVFFWGIDVFE